MNFLYSAVARNEYSKSQSFSLASRSVNENEACGSSNSKFLIACQSSCCCKVMVKDRDFHPKVKRPFLGEFDGKSYISVWPNEMNLSLPVYSLSPKYKTDVIETYF